MAIILKRPQAQADLDEIFDYIAVNNLEGAVALLRELNEKIQTLAINSYMGRKRNELLYELRSFPCRNYVIFYLPITNGIDVIRVLHGAQDIEKIFSIEGLPE
jgi:toxin ParE1/3/4